MFYSGLPICCGVTLPRNPSTELLSRKGGMIDGDVIAGDTTCPRCGSRIGYTLKPTTADLETAARFDALVSLVARQGSLF